MKEDFDDILKRKWAEQHFPVDDGHREQMIALLDKKKRRGVIPFWWIGGLLLIGAVAAYLLMHDPADPVITSGKDARDTWEIPGSEAGVSSPEKMKALPSTGNNSQTDQQQMNDGSSSSPSSPANSSTTETGASVHSGTPSGSINTLQKPASNTSNVSGKPGSADMNLTKPTTMKPDQASVNPEQYSGAGVEHNIPASPQVIGPDITVKEESGIDVFSVVTTPTPEDRKPMNLLPVASLDMEGIAFTSDHAPGPVDPVVKTNRTFYAFGETGIGMIFPSQNNYDAGWKFRAGAGLGYKLNQKVQLTLSLGYLLQAGGFDFQRTSTVDFAGFGARSSFNSLTPDKLHYVYTRLGAQYRMHRHIIGVHGGVQYLYGAQGELVTQVQDQFAPGTTETTEYAWVVTDGLRKVNWTADVSYGYQLTPRLFASAGADFYFSTITVEDQALAQDGYYWSGAYAPVHPFITLNYLIYEGR